MRKSVSAQIIAAGVWDGDDAFELVSAENAKGEVDHVLWRRVSDAQAQPLDVEIESALQRINDGQSNINGL